MLLEGNFCLCTQNSLSYNALGTMHAEDQAGGMVCKACTEQFVQSQREFLNKNIQVMGLER